MNEQKQWMPRERLQCFGADSLSDVELLAVILRTGTKGIPVQEMARNLLKRFKGSLLHLCDATPTELSEVCGMGTAKSLELCAAFALAKRLSRQRLAERPQMGNPLQIAEFMRGFFCDTAQEEFYALLLDSQLHLLHAERVSIGLVDRSLVHAREVFRRAIRESCSSIILCHNHPSGNVRPSHADRVVTQSLAYAGLIIGIRVVDHIIVGGKVEKDATGYYSFLENKQMPELTALAKSLEVEDTAQDSP